MQQATDGIQSFEDGRGRRWRAAAGERQLVEEVVAPWLGDDASLPAPLVTLKRSKRREVYRALVPGVPPLLIKRYPPRRGLLGRSRDRVAPRAAAEFAMARRLGELGLPTPRPLAWATPADPDRPSWFVSQLLLGARPLGTWLEERFRPGDGTPAKLAVARRALAELARLHDAGIWHRDFHGGNLLLHEGEGPAARLWFIDLHAAAELGTLPPKLRARDVADFLHSLRYAFSREEVDALIADPGQRLEPARVAAALARKREAQAQSRGARALLESSRYAQARLGTWRVSHDRSLDLRAIEWLLAGHGDALIRAGRRSRLSVQRLLDGRSVLVKELVGAGARRRARGEFLHGVAAVARDLPVATPLAYVRGGAGEPAFALAVAIAGATPLHLLAHRVPRDAAERAAIAAIARAVLDLLVALVRQRFVHPDLSLKNLLVREGAAPALTLVDLEPARPARKWTLRRLVRALAQLGDVPRRTFSRSQRLRFLDELRERLALPLDRATLARASAERLRERQKLRAPLAPFALEPIPATLHLFGNWKWTGPAEPAVAVAAALAPRARLVAGRCPFPDLGQPVAEHAAARAVPHSISGALRKHWNPLRTGRAASAVLEAARAHGADAVHVHLDADHAAAELARSRLEQRPALVRHVHEAGPHAARTRRLLRRAELLVAPTRGIARSLETELGLPPQHVAVLETSVDLDRFAPGIDGAARRARGRARLGLAPDDAVFGIVARIQRHRRYDLLFEAWAGLAASGGAVPKLVVLGRGTNQDELAREPIARLGLAEHVRLPGYLERDEYVDALAACDAGIFLVPGTDVSCRAVREWMASGRAVIATRRAPLPELIDDGVDGRLIDERASDLAAAVRELADRTRAARGGQKAAEKARRRFDPRGLRSRALLLDRLALLARPGGAAAWRGPAEVLAAARPGRIDAVLEVARHEGLDPERLVVFDPARSRDAALDLVMLANEARPRLLLLEPHGELDATLAGELRRAAGTVLRLDEPGVGAAAASPLDRCFDRRSA